MSKTGRVFLVIVLLVLIVPVSNALRTMRANNELVRRVATPPSFGFDDVTADILWLKAIQFLSDVYLSSERGKFSEEDTHRVYVLFDRIVTLKPKFTRAYEFGGLALSVRAPEYAVSLLNKGIESNPEAGWKLPFYAGVIANQWMKEPRIAYTYYEKVSVYPDRPAHVDRFFGRVAAEAVDLRTALEMWLNIYQDATDKLEKEMAKDGLVDIADKIIQQSNDLKLIKAAEEIKTSM